MDFNQLLDLGLSKKYISQEDIKPLKLEDFLNWLNQEKRYLLHGSGILIPASEKLISRRKVFHATDDGGVAIIKALFPNNLPGQTNLNYRIDKSGIQEVILEGDSFGELVREKGYIYVLENEGFSNQETQGIADFEKP